MSDDVYRPTFRALVVETFRADLAAWQANGWSAGPITRGKAARMLLWYPGMRATLMHRLAWWGKERGVPGLPMVLSGLNTALHGIELPPGVPIGPGLYLPHTVGTVINATRIGSGVTLQGGITIGLRTEPVFPVIEDGVTIAAGARVLGNVTVGAGAIVGANAVVVKDVPPGATMVGVPARAIK